MHDMGNLETSSGKRRKEVRLVLGLLLLGVLGAFIAFQAGLFGGHGVKEHAGHAKSEKYTCGMHPWIIADKPGDCPICGMKLTKIEEMPEAAKTGPSPTPQAGQAKPADDFFADLGKKPVSGGSRKLLFYRNPMNPMITSPVPGKDEMGMDFVPVYEDEVQNSQAVVEGRVAVRLTAESLKASGVQTTAATEQAIRRTVRTVGIVTPDETRIRHVHTKIDGWVETLHTNFRGQLVEKGAPILSLYSPTLLAGQEEYLRAREAAQKFSANQDEGLQRLGKQLFEAARRRLELYDVPESFIAELDRTGKVRRTVTFNAPVSGFVMAKDIFEGQQVSPGLELFTITDLSRVWIEADLYEYEARAVAIGQEAVLNLPYDPGVALTGQVTYVNPFLTPESRTLKVRFEFANPGYMLKPAMYADVTLVLATAQGVVVPDSALMDTGVRKLVFVQTASDTFSPREVRVGVRGDGLAQILSGVLAGEQVVVKANFLIDSESRLRAALAGPAGGHGGH